MYYFFGAFSEPCLKLSLNCLGFLLIISDCDILSKSHLYTKKENIWKICVFTGKNLKVKKQCAPDLSSFCNLHSSRRVWKCLFFICFLRILSVNLSIWFSSFAIKLFELLYKFICSVFCCCSCDKSRCACNSCF